MVIPFNSDGWEFESQGITVLGLYVNVPTAEVVCSGLERAKC